MAKTISLYKKPVKTYKYNIREQLGLLPKSTKVQDVIAALKSCGISQDQFYRDQKILSGSESEISYERLTIYAQLFGCTVDDLVNNIPTVKPLRESFKIKTKLK